MRKGLGRDVVMMLRLQLERMDGAYRAPRRASISTSSASTREAGRQADALVMHPGPMNRGVEIDSEVADDINRRLIQEQVEMGVAVRMAVLETLAKNAPEPGATKQ
jgi:aspartate carbamoyltransferase catalytic subunit